MRSQQPSAGSLGDWSAAAAAGASHPDRSGRRPAVRLTVTVRSRGRTGAGAGRPAPAPAGDRSLLVTS